MRPNVYSIDPLSWYYLDINISLFIYESKFNFLFEWVFSIFLDAS